MTSVWKRGRSEMLWEVVVAALVVCVVASGLPQAVWTYYRMCRAVRHLPGWPTHWFWGNLHQLKRDEATLLKWLAFIQENRYKMTRVWVGPLFPAVLINHCDLLHEVIKLPKPRSLYTFFLPWLGDGLLLSEKQKWFRNRRLLTPAFHYEILKGYVPEKNNCIEVLLKKWLPSAESGESVCVFKDISKLSLDILMWCAFSIKSNCQLYEEELYINCVYKLVSLVHRRFHSFFYRSDFIYFLTKDGRQFKQLCSTVHNYTESIIEERKKAWDINESDSTEESESILKRATERRWHLDFLDILLTARDEEGKGLTDVEIRDEADTFLFEGHDTTTSGISWTLYCLAKYPQHQDEVRKEVNNVLMGRQFLEYDDLKDLNYTTWCIKEAMRLYPPVPEVIRIADEDIEIGGHCIPKGMPVEMQIRVIHRHPDYWEDPNEYNPLRFHPTAAKGRRPYAYIPFSAGNRNCIGQNFALNEEKMVVASILHRFRIALDKDHKVELAPHIVFRTKSDIKIKIVKASD